MPLDRGRTAGAVPVQERNQEVVEEPAARLDLEGDTAVHEPWDTGGGRLRSPLVGIAAGWAAAALFGLYGAPRVIEAPGWCSWERVAGIRPHTGNGALGAAVGVPRL